MSKVRCCLCDKELICNIVNVCKECSKKLPNMETWLRYGPFDPEEYGCKVYQS